VLVGLPGAGKSTVGRLVALALGWRFVDLDRAIEDRTGRTVRELFARDGEAAFRRLEREETERYAGVRDLVLAPGGGWVLDPENLAALGAGSLTVFLKVSPGVALDRLRAQPGTRPLLEGDDPLERLERLSEARIAAYMQSNHVLSADSATPSQLADSIVALARGTSRD
jgi:shikimate kinase